MTLYFENTLSISKYHYVCVRAYTHIYIIQCVNYMYMMLLFYHYVCACEIKEIIWNDISVFYS